MKTRRFDFNFTPLQMNVCFTVDGSVPDKQNYDADTDTFTPDYSITPLIILPAVSRLDKNEVLSAGRVNQELANIKWYEIYNGVTTLIESTNTNYEYEASGGQAGRIKVKRNAQPNNPITLKFVAEYTDSRTNQIHTIQGTHQILCGNSTRHAPVLLLEAADQTIYNPVRDADTQTITASLRLGENECPASKRIFVWEKFREDGTWTTVGSDILDYDVTVSSDGASVTVDRSLMGEKLCLRCRAKYDFNGNPAGVTLTDAAPQKIVSIVRRIPYFDFQSVGCPTNISPGTLAVCPEIRVWDTYGLIANPDKVFVTLWYMATNKASGTLSYTQVAHGKAPTIPTKAMSQLYGGVMGFDVIDRGPALAWADSDGSVFVDADGSILIFD